MSDKPSTRRNDDTYPVILESDHKPFKPFTVNRIDTCIKTRNVAVNRERDGHYAHIEVSVTTHYDKRSAYVSGSVILDRESTLAFARELLGAEFQITDLRTPDHKPYVTVTHGMRGYFAVLLIWNDENGGFYEPMHTGVTCKTHAEAVAEGKLWAAADNVEYR